MYYLSLLLLYYYLEEIKIDFSIDIKMIASRL